MPVTPVNPAPVKATVTGKVLSPDAGVTPVTTGPELTINFCALVVFEPEGVVTITSQVPTGAVPGITAPAIEVSVMEPAEGTVTAVPPMLMLFTPDAAVLAKKPLPVIVTVTAFPATTPEGEIPETTAES